MLASADWAQHERRRPTSKRQHTKNDKAITPNTQPSGRRPSRTKQLASESSTLTLEGQAGTPIRGPLATHAKKPTRYDRVGTCPTGGRADNHPPEKIVGRSGKSKTTLAILNQRMSPAIPNHEVFLPSMRTAATSCPANTYKRRPSRQPLGGPLSAMLDW